jgi:uncharacterized membrane protein YsdA (DUF1294 family)
MRKAIAFRFGLALFCIAIITALIMWWIFSLDFLYSWLIAVNLITIICFGYDKWAAPTSMTRVPESVLLLLTLFGGTFGALLGMTIFRHKVSKSEFKTKFILVLIVQAVLIAVYYYIR